MSWFSKRGSRVHPRNAVEAMVSATGGYQTNNQLSFVTNDGKIFDLLVTYRNGKPVLTLSEEEK